MRSTAKWKSGKVEWPITVGGMEEGRRRFIRKDYGLLINKGFLGIPPLSQKDKGMAQCHFFGFPEENRSAASFPVALLATAVLSMSVSGREQVAAVSGSVEEGRRGAGHISFFGKLASSCHVTFFALSPKLTVNFRLAHGQTDCGRPWLQLYSWIDMYLTSSLWEMSVRHQKPLFSHFFLTGERADER